MTTNQPLGIGFVGAGPVTQAIHLPTLARLSGLLRVAHVMDVDAATAAAVAGRVGANHSTSLEALLADHTVDIVAINSPSPFHAAQTEAALRAGKRAVFVEKPFATTRAEATHIAALAREAGVPVVVGAMHTYDPGWLAARAAWPEVFDRVHTIRSSVVLPPNPLFEDWATEVAQRGAPPPPRDFTNPDVRAAAISGGVLGLAIHDLPLIRALLPDWRAAEIRSARPLAPFGYLINIVAGDRRVQLLANMHRHRRPEWTLDCFGDAGSVRVAFTPSYVHAGSAVASLRTAAGETILSPENYNGYEGEWRHLHAVLTQGAPLAQPVDALIDDLDFAIAIAEASAAKARMEDKA